VNGSCAGGGYELALATDHILLVDDGSTTVSLPEAPLLAVLPGTGGLTRLTDKRKVRRDRADVFCTTEEGIRGKRAVEWNLVDEVAPRSRFAEAVAGRAQQLGARSDRPADEGGVELTALERTIEDNRITYPHVAVELDRTLGVAEITVSSPLSPPPQDMDGIRKQGAGFWPLALARELDDLILRLRANEDSLGVWVFRTTGESNLVEQADAALRTHADHWLAREITLYLKRTLKRLDVTSRSMIALLEPGSCFTGTLFELALAADRSYMLDGQMDGDNRPPPVVRLTGMNFGPYPMANGLTRLETRFLGAPGAADALREQLGEDIDGVSADGLGLVTFAPDDIDWDDEVRIALEERASFSPDVLTGMEANLRFPGPETMETRIFARLSAWQNWIFQRPNAVGDEGALQLYGTGGRAKFDKHRI
jgi:benzoyl-CoA-dihydrodiol lyase